MNNVYNIKASDNFLALLADKIIAETTSNIEQLSDYIIILPTQRSRRTLIKHLVNKSNNKAILLPDIKVISDDNYDNDLKITKIKKIIILAKLVNEVPDFNIYNTDQSIKFGEQLANLIDNLQRENISLTAIKKLINTHDYAEHWHKTIIFLCILIKNWQTIIDEEGFIDNVATYNININNIINKIGNKPVIVAGINSSLPLLEKLILHVSSIPNGRIIIQGMDNNIDSKEWNNCDPTHPQYHIKQLLLALNINRDQVQQFNQCNDNDIKQNDLLISQSTQKYFYQPQHTINKENFSNINIIECAHQEDEATTIAIIMKHAIAKNKDCCVITPNRNLAQQICNKMLRWNIKVNNSAGNSIMATSQGALLRITAQLLTQNFSAITLLSLLKHPLFAIGMKKKILTTAITNIEIKILRKSAASINNWPLLLAKIKKYFGKESTEHNVVKKIYKYCYNKLNNFAEILSNHISFIESVSITPDHEIAIWSKVEGEALGQYIKQILINADNITLNHKTNYTKVINALLNNYVVRPNQEDNPNLAVLGLIEARLQYYSIAILADVTEECWSVNNANQWLNNNMRNKIGFINQEKALGNIAYDFYNYCSMPEVFITFTTDNNKTPANWLLRLKTVLKLNNYDFNKKCYFWQLAQIINKKKPELNNNNFNFEVPTANPNVNHRPISLSATQINLLINNPYEFYLKYILKIYSLEDLQPKFSQQHFGIFVHNMLQKYFSHNYELEQFIKYAKKQFNNYLLLPNTWAFWWPKFLHIMQWINNNFHDRQAKKYTEISGEIIIDNIKLTAKADLILCNEQTTKILDYKTGHIAPISKILTGHEPQIGLYALIGKELGFANITNPVSHLIYWTFPNKNYYQECKEIIISSDAEQIQQLADKFSIQMQQLIARYITSKKPYIAKNNKIYPNNPYNHLLRINDWQIQK